MSQTQSNLSIDSNKYQAMIANQNIKTYLMIKTRKGVFNDQLERQVYIKNGKIIQRKGSKQIQIDQKSLVVQSQQQVYQQKKNIKQAWNQNFKLKYRVIAQELKNKGCYISLYCTTQQQADDVKRLLYVTLISQHEKGIKDSLRRGLSYGSQLFKAQIMNKTINQLKLKLFKFKNQETEKNISAIKQKRIKDLAKFFRKYDDKETCNKFLSEWYKLTLQDQFQSIQFLDIRFYKIKLLKSILPQEPYVTIEVCGQTLTSNIYPIQQTTLCLIYMIKLPLSFKLAKSRIPEKQQLKIVISSKTQMICTRNLLISEILYGNKIGKFYNLGLVGVGKYQIDYTKIDSSKETYHILKEYPFIIQVSGIQNNGKLENISFKQERRFELRSSLTMIGNYYGMQYDVDKMTEEKIKVYEKVFHIPHRNILNLEYLQKINETIQDEFELEQSKSENSELIGDVYFQKIYSKEENLNQLTNYNKLDLFKLAERGFQKKYRLFLYENLLEVKKIRQLFQFKTQQLQNLVSKIHYIDLRNFTQDFNKLGRKNQIVYKIVLWFICIKGLIKDRKLFYCSSIINIADRLVWLVQYQRYIYQGMHAESQKQKQIEEYYVTQRSFWLLLAFILKIGIYYQNNTDIISNDLIKLRILTRILLKQFNFTLNKQLIGLQNLMAPKLLDIFSKEHPQLNYRIWDILIYSFRQQPNKNIFPYIGFTYLNYLQSNGITNFIPVNNFILSLINNINKIQINKTLYEQITSANFRNIQEYKVRNKLIENLAQQKFIRRFIYSEPEIEIADQNLPSDMKRSTNPKNIKTNNSNVKQNYYQPFPLNTIAYPLPSPTFVGSPIVKIHLMIKKISIYNSMGLQPYKLLIRKISDIKKMNSSMNQENSDEISVYSGGNKNLFLNFYTQLEKVDKIEIEASNSLIRLSTGTINLMDGYHKDFIYKNHYRLVQVSSQIKNISQSVVQILFIIESVRKNKEQKVSLYNYKSFFLKNVVDYDFSEQNNLPLTQIRLLNTQLQRMKSPLDEYGTPYLSLKLISTDEKQFEWIKNSKITMEQLKAHFYKIFSQKHQKELKMLWSTFYKQFTFNKQYQFFQLGKFLLNLILLCKSTRHDKICFFYTLITHYQNTPKKFLTKQSLYSIYEQLYLFYGFINPYPYFIESSNQIQSASIIFNSNSQNMLTFIHQKTEIKDITQIIKSWVFISHVKYRSKDIILGDNDRLSILKNLLNYEIILKIQQQSGCKIQIIYKLNSSKHIWTAQIDSQFNIIKRGEKIFNQYPKYFTPNKTNSQAQLLYSCENIIPLTNYQPIPLEKLKGLLQENALLNYYLSMNIDLEEKQENVRRSDISVNVYLGKQLNSTVSLNSNNPNSIRKVQGTMKLRDIRLMIEQKINLKIDTNQYNKQYVLQGTLLYDEQIIFKQILNLISVNTKFIQLHYYKMAPKQTVPTNQVDNNGFNNLALYRHQDSLQEWKECEIIRLFKNEAIVRFKDLAEYEFKIPDYEIINLQEKNK